MLSNNVLSKEAKRLFALPFPPSTEESKIILLGEYIRVLRDYAESGDHLKAIIDHVMNTAKRCPPTVDVHEAAMEIRPPAKTKAPVGCEKCQGSGYIQYTRLVQASPGMMRCEASFAQPCDCALGQFIQPEYDKRRDRAPGAAQDLG